MIDRLVKVISVMVMFVGPKRIQKRERLGEQKEKKVLAEEEVSIDAEAVSEKLLYLTKSVVTSLIEQTRGAARRPP